MSEATENAVLVERRGRNMVITLNRPDAMNAINGALSHGLLNAVRELDADSSLTAGVITGNGRAFCAGMDLKAFAATGERPHVPGRGFGGLVEQPPSKPLIAAVEGFALGGGMEIALACDVIVAARDARFGLPEVRRGLVPAAGALLRLPALIPRGAAFELVLTGEPLPAQRAFELGLVTRLTDPGRALEQAVGLATAIVAGAPLATLAATRILRESAAWPPGDAWKRQAMIADPVMQSRDAGEGARAFAEKRSPCWQGE